MFQLTSKNLTAYRIVKYCIGPELLKSYQMVKLEPVSANEVELTNNPVMLIVLDVAEELGEVEVLEENPAHVLVVDRVQNLLLSQGLDLFPGLLVVVTLKFETLQGSQDVFT